MFEVINMDKAAHEILINAQITNRKLLEIYRKRLKINRT